MTRYWDSCAESLESVMRFISERNWSSVGVAMVDFVDGRDEIGRVIGFRVGSLVLGFTSRIRKRQGGGLCTISPQFRGNIDQQ